MTYTHECEGYFDLNDLSPNLVLYIGNTQMSVKRNLDKILCSSAVTGIGNRHFNFSLPLVLKQDRYFLMNPLIIKRASQCTHGPFSNIYELSPGYLIQICQNIMIFIRIYFYLENFIGTWYMIWRGLQLSIKILDNV